MSDEGIVAALKILKQNKQTVMRCFSKQNNENSYTTLQMEELANQVDEYVQELKKVVIDQSQTFEKYYDSEEMFLDAVTISMETIDQSFEKITSIYLQVKNAKTYDKNDTIRKILMLIIIEQILHQYMRWIEKIEMVFLGMDIDADMDGELQNIVLKIEISKEIELLRYISQLKGDQDKWIFPFLGGLGLGILFE